MEHSTVAVNRPLGRDELWDGHHNTLGQGGIIMAEESIPTDNTPELENALLEKVSEFNGHAGNVRLRTSLGWNDDQYWIIRDRLVDSGRLMLGRGKGGSVTLVQPVGNEGADSAAAVPTAEAIVSETDLYQDIAQVLGKEWARDMRFRNSIVEVTALQGRRDTGGKWTRPDIVVAGLRVFPHVPGKFFDLVTFEVKPSNGIDISAVFEALAHRRAATQSYVWLHVPLAGQSADLLERLTDEARRHGIGLIVASKPSEYDTWDIIVQAARVEPDPEDLNGFIARQVSSLNRDELAQWFR